MNEIEVRLKARLYKLCIEYNKDLLKLIEILKGWHMDEILTFYNRNNIKPIIIKELEDILGENNDLV